ncbi:MAG TPA: hypothetical protein PLF32_09080 [Bacteroidales bacterium]|jgi:hypothetical protein|nr:hypothetical protein [Bacteroidales bacterium]HOF17025.1 hypothetical protein [Bacteroidales bacterium]HON21033.1 hypothetical protein [Bacteroidales bacterium]HOR82791.1 hypothetical protein [Bacteroidales bacterium]HPJ92073.1 hypothetical protein [Bacteroidales bacterium]
MTKKNNSIREKILLGLELTHTKLIRTKKERNFVLVVSDEGKVVRVNPKNL